MEKRLKEVLNREEGNYILPFSGSMGKTAGRLREMMGAVYSSGIRAVCVESRPHPDFAGPGWWRDMDIIMDEARKRNMRVWVLMMPISLPDTATDLLRSNRSMQNVIWTILQLMRQVPGQEPLFSCPLTRGKN